jgi:hypothetical protein
MLPGTVTLLASMSGNQTNPPVVEFALGYTTDQREAIRFAWNGKYAAEFRDENQEFRSAVAQLIISDPDLVPIVLIRDILLEDASWSHEAWCAPHHFAGLLSILLQRGGREYLVDFAAAMNATFDTFGAAHEVVISQQQAHELLEETKLHLLIETDARRCSELESARELFRKLIAGNATQGWVTVPPGTPVRNIRVLGSVPATAHTFRNRLMGFFRRRGK